MNKAFEINKVCEEYYCRGCSYCPIGQDYCHDDELAFDRLVTKGIIQYEDT